MRAFSFVLACAIFATAHCEILSSPATRFQGTNHSISPTSVKMPVTGDVKLIKEEKTAYVCSPYDKSTPEIAHANLLAYLRGGNKEGVNLLADKTSYPLSKYFSEEILCIYLPKAHHCYPPAPFSKDIGFLVQTWPIEYYSIMFWGHPSRNRMLHYATAMDNALEGKTDFDTLTTRISYWPNHMKELAVTLKNQTTSMTGFGKLPSATGNETIASAVRSLKW